MPLDASAVIDLDRYPIARANDPRRQQLVANCRQELVSSQFCVLPDLLTDAALAGLVAEVGALQPQAYRNRSHRNCYLQRQGDPSQANTQPSNIFFDASYNVIACDLFAADSPLIGLYHWPEMIRFIAEVVDEPVLHASADPYQPVNVLCYGQGNSSAWHFDSSNAFTMTLMLQAAESGGEFEIVPDTRTASDPCNAELSAVLLGDRSRVRTVPREPGALVIFRGTHSVHRVTPVEGSRQRLMAVFVYETEPGVVGDPEVNATVYGPRTQGVGTPAG